MEQASSDILESIVAKDTWTAEDHRKLLKHFFSTRNASHKFREILADMEAASPAPKGGAALKIGIARYMLCRFAGALEAFAEATDNRDRRYFAGQCYRSMRQYDQAAEEFQRAKSRGWDGPEADIMSIEALALGGKIREARKDYTALARQLGETAESYYLRGLLDEMSGLGDQAVESYEKARQLSGSCPEATFRLAYYLDLHGEEDRAIELYGECLSCPPVYANALLNQAVLHEDAGRYEQAIALLRRLLATYPDHARARLFLKDAEASKNMYYDEDQAKRIAKRNAVLDIPVTDFELSVRARNCLKKMNIMTLGDLVRTSEAELLGYKNFGETSLKEIKEMLTAKGLRLGPAQDDGGEYSSLSLGAEQDSDDEEENGLLATPLSQIEFSVRARRVLEQLKVHTLGELAAKTEAELLAQQNFGQTSLIEMRQKLVDYGLKFRESK